MKRASVIGWLTTAVLTLALLPTQWAPVAIVVGLVFGGGGQILLWLIRCRICGTRVWSCSTALALRRDQRMQWISTINACPVCGDDGRASDESRVRWVSAGSKRERPYWSWSRMLFAIVLAALILAAYSWIARRYKATVEEVPLRTSACCRTLVGSKTVIDKSSSGLPGISSLRMCPIHRCRARLSVAC
jgi:hypothetical protein